MNPSLPEIDLLDDNQMSIILNKFPLINITLINILSDSILVDPTVDKLSLVEK